LRDGISVTHSSSSKIYDVNFELDFFNSKTGFVNRKMYDVNSKMNFGHGSS
jgi:hypothetical protein